MIAADVLPAAFHRPRLAAPGRIGLARTAALIGVVIGTGGCASRTEVEKKVAFNEAAHAPWMAKGDATIRGEGFLRRPNGSLVRCAGELVYLVPASPYFREWAEVYRSGGRLANPEALNAAHGKAVRRTQCQMTGRFEFADLPAGKWLVVSRIAYQERIGSDDSTLLAEVETKAEGVTLAILSNPNRI
jgi:hypothetical protein